MIQAHIITNQLEKTWLTKYPWPTQVILDQGLEFMAKVARILKHDYRIRRKPITERNAQANTIIERAHQTIGSILCTF